MNTKTANLPFIGVDIGGSHITASHVDCKSYKVIESTMTRIRVASMDTAEVIINSWVEALSPMIVESAEGDIKLGIAMPGPFDYENGISLMKGQEKYDSLYGMNVREILSDRLGIPGEHIVFINDAEAFLRGELASGAASDFEKAIGVTLGTGLGSSSNCKGEPVDVNRAFVPFLDSIAEEYISTRWFLKRYKELTGQSVKNVEDLLSTTDQGIKDQLFEEFATNLANFLNDFIADENPEVLVVGGNIAKTWNHFMPALQSKIVNKKVVIRQTEMWEDAALVGAACSWI
ncbi:ROK family protein [Pedobacter metabolipauper]|uniref:Glucokinase n=1 Tax=Pedobacter metabolipauper TaxID=425513 RepID=A0A4R6SS42_9SPHI|nr:ROK family protein [Pedobacter metabolipauper]TDQ07348.1 glucokinase [Pedobacter metabolipauper]